VQRHIIIIFLKSKDRILKIAKEKQHLAPREKTNRTTTDLSLKVMKFRMMWPGEKKTFSRC
jgi:hypothetical protein